MIAEVEGSTTSTKVQLTTALTHLAQGKLLLARLRCSCADERTRELVRLQCEEVQKVIADVQAIDIDAGAH